MMYKYYSNNNNFDIEDTKLQKQYNQLHNNNQDMQNAIHKNVRALVYLTGHGSLPAGSHPYDIMSLAGCFLNNVLPQGAKFILQAKQAEDGPQQNIELGPALYSIGGMFDVCLGDGSIIIGQINQQVATCTNEQEKLKAAQEYLESLNQKYSIDVLEDDPQKILTHVVQYAKCSIKTNDSIIKEDIIAILRANNMARYPYLYQNSYTGKSEVNISAYVNNFLIQPILGADLNALSNKNVCAIIENINKCMERHNTLLKHVFNYQSRSHEDYTRFFMSYIIDVLNKTPSFYNLLSQHLSESRQKIKNYFKKQSDKNKTSYQDLYKVNYYPGLYSINGGGHYYNVLLDNGSVYECGQNNIPQKNTNKSPWGNTGHSKYSFKTGTASKCKI